jgi:hypothetical protein
MTRDEFIAGYCAASKVTWEWLRQYRDAVPCDCGDEICEGWAMISKEDAPWISATKRLMEP